MLPLPREASARSCLLSSSIFGASLLARVTRPALSRLSWHSRASWAFWRVRLWASLARAKSDSAASRAASRASANALQPPEKITVSMGESSTMRSTRSSRSRSWLAISRPPGQVRIRFITAFRPSVSRLLVGSSSRRRSGASRSWRARATRMRSPPLRGAMLVLRGTFCRPVSARACSIRVGSVQSASAASSTLPSPRSNRSRQARASVRPSAPARSSVSSSDCCSMPARPGRWILPEVMATSPTMARSSVDLPQPLRPTRPTRSRPSESVRPRKSGVPSGVERDRESSVRKLVMGGPGHERETQGEVRRVLHFGLPFAFGRGSSEAPT